MLLAYGVKNFFSFREEAIISFQLDANCPPSIAQGHDTTSVLCIKGANGSGKTQILKALSFIGHFCANSFANRPDEDISISPFFNSPEPIEFFVEFRMGEMEYRYELSATNQTVLRETVYKTRAKQVKIVERIGNAISYRLQGLHALDVLTLRSNVSLIATSLQYGLAELAEVALFFQTINSNVRYHGMSELTSGIDSVSEFLATHPEVLGFVKSFITQCDVGIEDIQIANITNREGRREYFPLFVHSANQGQHAISDMMESSGTRTLFKNLAAYQLTLLNGGVLVIDEFDLNLHPHILPKLLALFLDAESNPQHAQLLISTHDTEVMNVLGRYRVYLVGKEDNESFAYRLDEIPGDVLRNDRPIRPAYNDGKIGGVPKI